MGRAWAEGGWAGTFVDDESNARLSSPKASCWAVASFSGESDVMALALLVSASCPVWAGGEWPTYIRSMFS